MNARNDIDTRIRRFCMISCTNEKEMENLGKSLLTIFRDVCRSNTGDAEEIIADLCSDSEEDDEFRRMNESLVRLEFFATEGERCRYERSIHSVLETGWMHFYEGMTFREIADAEGTQEAPIDRSIQSAKKKIREYLKKSHKHGCQTGFALLISERAYVSGMTVAGSLLLSCLMAGIKPQSYRTRPFSRVITP